MFQKCVNVYRLHALKFIHAWHKGVLPELLNHFFPYASNVHNYNTKYLSNFWLGFWFGNNQAFVPFIALAIYGTSFQTPYGKHHRLRHFDLA